MSWKENSHGELTDIESLAIYEQNNFNV